ncbi:hypothetical protein C922_05480 [Plasmodium inui San Antonio 1]|uniref:Uncharacterized protein n=1 Tax=Plasmodium inui San Antonio 1 TaxID=1237626 RepID=W6ZXW0_9APIC|nr:hypothetical protein C922_05480 [Plasmodium inui San Antonio 1]EUD64138.1 hypothetical protein C922_05480 [Plasmodium inui San Antonio 1]
MTEEEKEGINLNKKSNMTPWKYKDTTEISDHPKIQLSTKKRKESSSQQSARKTERFRKPATEGRRNHIFSQQDRKNEKRDHQQSQKRPHNNRNQRTQTNQEDYLTEGRKPKEIEIPLNRINLPTHLYNNLREAKRQGRSETKTQIQGKLNIKEFTSRET